MKPTYQWEKMAGPLTMTARELIAALQGLPEAMLDMPVVSEGCDCNGEVFEIDISNESRVYLRRNNEDA